MVLVEGQTFCISDRTGDVFADLPNGLFHLDTRVISHLELLVDGHRLEALTVDVPDPFTADFVTRARPAPGHADADLVVRRRRRVGAGLQERVTITNYGLRSVDSVVELRCDVDFADLFAVKESRVRSVGGAGRPVGAATLRFDHPGIADAVELEVTGSAAVAANGFTWRVHLEPQVPWEVRLEVFLQAGGVRLPSRVHGDGAEDRAVPARRMAAWRAGLPSVDSDPPALAEALRRAATDLGALRVFDDDHPETSVLSAGAPWFMAVFGRDSLLTAWMALIADASLARGVLETLARFQGVDVDPVSEEEPGKILHEIRFGAAGGTTLRSGNVYFGSVDATPLFVMLLGELHRWHGMDGAIDAMLPHADRALDWIADHGDARRTGYLEYGRRSDRGLANQGWKDSWDAIRHADGTLAQAPVALCEVQGYVYAAHVARAELAEALGDPTTADVQRSAAAALRRRFNEDFWLDDRGWFAMGLDAEGRPIDALASNMGHCLWTGIVDPPRAALVADRLVSEDLFSGWGVRTLATSMTGFNPVSYHNGSVWPHDTALAIAGLTRYGFIDEAHRLVCAQLDLAGAMQGRLPELVAGFPRGDPHSPAPYPASCSPQAWASAAPLLWLRSLLRIDPSAPDRRVWLHPDLPPGLRHLHVEGIAVAGHRLTVDVRDDVVEIAGAGDLDVRTEARPTDPMPT